MKLSATALLATTFLSAGAFGTAWAADTLRPAAVDADMFEPAPAREFGAHLGDVDPASRMHVMLTLPLRDEAGAEDFVRHVSDPNDALYGHYIKAREFGDRFGASAADFGAVAKWAHDNGLAVVRASVARTTLTVVGDVATVQRAFATRLGSFRTATGAVGFAPMVAPRLPAELVGKVSAVVGLTDSGRVPTLYRKADPKVARPVNAEGSAPLGGYGPANLQLLYRLPKPLTKAAPQTLAVFEQGGFELSDYSFYKTYFRLPDVPVTVVAVNGSPTKDRAGVDTETLLDLDSATAVNPALSKIVVYEDAVDPFPLAIIDSLNQMAEDDTAKTISISYGFDEAFTGNRQERAVQTAAMELGAQGQTIFVSAGDDGAYGNEPPGLNASFPCTDPYMSCVGGTTLFTYEGFYGGEEVWNDLGIGAGATGGGISSVFHIPKYQRSNGIDVVTANGGSATMRNVPDVAAVGNPETGFSLYQEKAGGWAVYGGTSLSSPVWGAFTTVLNTARQGAGLATVGFFNPALYLLGSHGVYGTRDVVDGSNGNAEIYGTAGYNAGFGYDNTTGFGSINVGHYTESLLTSLRNVGAGAKPSAPTNVTTTPADTSVKVSWTAGNGALGYFVLVITGDETQEVSEAVTTGTSATVKGLTAGTAYRVVVYSENNAGSAAIGSKKFATAGS